METQRHENMRTWSWGHENMGTQQHVDMRLGTWGHMWAEEVGQGWTAAEQARGGTRVGKGRAGAGKAQVLLCAEGPPPPPPHPPTHYPAINTLLITRAGTADWLAAQHLDTLPTSPGCCLADHSAPGTLLHPRMLVFQVLHPKT